MTALDRGRVPDATSEPVVLGHLRKWIARGYIPTTTWISSVEYFFDDLLEGADLSSWANPWLAEGMTCIGLVAPMHVEGGSLVDQERHIANLLDRLEEVRLASPRVVLVFFVGMQWLVDGQRKEAATRLRALVHSASGRDNIHTVGLLLRGPAKVRTLNAAILAAETLRLTGLAWVDDDVLLEPNCIERMVVSFLERGCCGAVGATKIPHAREYITSKALHRAKEIAAPATSYPHGCCILVATDVVAGGIPDRYTSDDGYVCFQLLDPTLDDPLRYLYLVPDARCHYHVAGPAGQTRRRIRRLLLNHHIYLADWPISVSRYYFRQILFNGMWPLAGWDGSDGFSFGVKKAAIKWLYFCWFAGVGAELYIRGVFRRPLSQVVHAGYAGLNRPADTCITSASEAKP